MNEPEAGQQEVVALATDARGGFVLLGMSELPAPPGAPTYRGNTSWVLARYDGNGKRLWRHLFTPEPREDGFADSTAVSLSLSPRGDIFVFGRVQGRLRLGGTVVEDTAFLVNLSAEGNPRWVRTDVLLLQDMAADGAEGVVVSKGTTVERYDAQGVLSWSWKPSSYMAFTTVAADAAGGALIAGSRPQGPFDSRGIIVRLSAEGTERWRTELGPDGPSFKDAVIRPEGGAVLVGEDFGLFYWGNDVVRTPCHPSGCYRGVFILSVDEDGHPQWGRSLDSKPLSGSETPHLAMDAQGSVAVTWQYAEGSELLRLSPTGESVWHAVYDNGVGCGRRIRGAAFLHEGDLVGAGMFFGTCSVGTSPSITADETDLFFQRLMP